MEKTPKDIELARELKAIFKKYREESILSVGRLLNDEIIELLEKMTDNFLEGEEK